MQILCLKSLFHSDLFPLAALLPRAGSPSLPVPPQVPPQVPLPAHLQRISCQYSPVIRNTSHQSTFSTVSTVLVRYQFATTNESMYSELRAQWHITEAAHLNDSDRGPTRTTIAHDDSSPLSPFTRERSDTFGSLDLGQRCYLKSLEVAATLTALCLTHCPLPHSLPSATLTALCLTHCPLPHPLPSATPTALCLTHCPLPHPLLPSETLTKPQHTCGMRAPPQSTWRNK